MNTLIKPELADRPEYYLYTNELANLLLNSLRCEKLIQRHLISEASLAAERLIPQAERSKHGIFFTPDKIVENLVNSLQPEISAGKTFFDPACGAGNLLLGIARETPIGPDLDETISLWSQRFGGCDLSSSFVEAAKLRLIFLAAYKHGLPELSEDYLTSLLNRFSNFHVGDYLKGAHGGNFDCIIANPPFSHVQVEKECNWSSGRTQLAAIFIAKIIQISRPGQRVVAVLPDVLRSGSRYDKWRTFIEENSKQGASYLLGRFAADVDVDVFILDFIKSNQSGSPEKINWIPQRPHTGEHVKLGDLYDVCVGPVVPFRLSGRGNFSPYITAKNCPQFGEVSKSTKIRFDGRKIEPPFVVIRRTSNPSDKNRLITTLINCTEPVAVENHLIVMRPKDGRIESCKRLIDLLAQPDATAQMNEKIRCRHLTVRSIKEMEF
ncbi:TPA: N-6 DNA methylase [Pseudomonas aeruginosa]|uniref:N-6 DNA methylase n=1 Tax=Pseudomonas aeruginosa TaxID=287 RepID=UPI000BB56D22|nr:N-6 DNA methylase [Pseudomonas aeruginosa]PBL43894.1 hypothetical protein B8B68_02080 [Pseudomonas aeruginosa]PBN14721.1 hypothetical protein B8A61_02080 [Pseudomonas aeruginosa]PBN20018.1 hypothetical protein B8B71_07955 [Pseudomonas aeruginosa]PBN20321.1 hypothetical protein B8B69_04935 [Pseudomonas aeruginosa]PBN36083.1 hypothetical protein B8B81_06510 [Pseudomonas aeruginosa]